MKWKERVDEEERFEVGGSCELYVDMYFNHMVEAAATSGSQMSRFFTNSITKSLVSSTVQSHILGQRTPDPELKPVAKG